MILIWKLFYPLMLYDCVTALCRYFLVSWGELSIQAVSAAITAGILGFFYRKSSDVSIGVSGIGLTIDLLLAGVSSCIFLNRLIEIAGLHRWFPGYAPVSELLFNPPLWIQIIAMGFLIPAAEELIFRGVAFRALRERYSFSRAAVISSLIFGIYHGNVPQAVYACGMGLLLAWCYERCGTILAPWLVHGAANITAVLGEHMAGERMAGELSAGAAAESAEAAITMIISGIILFLAFSGIKARGKTLIRR